MTAQLPSKVRLAQIASFSKSMALPPSHDEIEAMARFALAAYEQDPYWWAIENRHGDARFVEEEHAKNDIWDEVHELNEKDDNGEYFDDNAPYKVVPVYRRPVLAAYEQEPVAYADPQAFDNFKSNEGSNAACTKEWMWRDQANGLVPLYTHPAPSIPAVPDEMPAGLFGQIVNLCAFNVLDKELAQKIWNACRAAMLNGGKS